MGRRSPALATTSTLTKRHTENPNLLSWSCQSAPMEVLDWRESTEAQEGHGHSMGWINRNAVSEAVDVVDEAGTLQIADLSSRCEQGKNQKNAV